MIGNDVHQLLSKYEPSQPDGGAVIKDWKCIFGKAMPLTSLSLIDLKVQLKVLYKKATAPWKPLLQIFC